MKSRDYYVIGWDAPETRDDVNRITDPARLRSLDSLALMDSPAEESFDRITRLAARLLKCPASVVTLIGEHRQYFKSCFGLPEPLATQRGSPLNLSFCRIAVQTGERLVIDDARTDKRVATHPAIEAFGIIAYAGYPIRTRDGHILGTLCVVDVVPRQWSEDDLEVLKELAASVESEIELLAAAEREREQARLQRTLIDASPLAVVVIDRHRIVHLWNDAAARTFQWNASEVIGKPLPIVPQDANDETWRRWENVFAGEVYQALSTVRVDRSGRQVQVRVSAAPLTSASGDIDKLMLIIEDVTEQVATDQERQRLFHQLEHERALLNALVDQMPAGVIAAELPTGRITLTNRMALSIVGDALPTMLNAKAFADLRGYHKDGRPYAPDDWPLARSINAGEVVSNEQIQFEQPNGERFPILASSTPVAPEGSEPTAAIVTFSDISDLKESEAALKRSEEKAKKVIESSQDCINVLDLEGHIRSINAGGLERLEVEDAAALRGSPWIDLWEDAYCDKATAALERARGGDAARFRGLLRTRQSNAKKWWDVIVTPILDEHSRPVQLLSISREVTEHVEAELERDALMRREREARRNAEIAEQKYRSLVNGLDAIVWEADLETWRFNFVSERAVEILGYPIERWENEPGFWESIIHPDDRERTARVCREACEACLDHDFEYRAITADGDTVWLRDIVYIETDDDGNPAHLRGVMVDVTSKKQLEAELRRRAEELSELDKRKDQFLALLAHELRNPLAPIGNAVDVLRFCAEDAAQVREIRDVLEDQVRQLVRLIDDLMDVSRITRGRIDLKCEPVLLHDVIETSIDTVRPACEELGHELIVHCDRAQSLSVSGDYVRLSQVLTNLLNNACKYTPPGGRIELDCRGDAQSVEITVKDNGVGIPKEYSDAIFDMFTQVESTLKESRGGLGLGLTLVKQLVELHGGSVALKSAADQAGSVFTVRLPALHTSKSVPQMESEREAPSVPRRVLIIDDVPAIARIFQKLIQTLGHETTAVYDASEGLQKAAEIQPDIIFSDICMPDMDGYELARRIRSLPAFQKTMLIAMTGNGQPEDVRAALKAGFDEHVVKPASLPKLRALFEAFESRESRGTRTHPSTQRSI